MMDITDATLQQLLIVEDEASLLDFECTVTGLPLWPQIRVAFLRMLISDLLYGTEMTGASTSRVRRGRAAVTMARSILQNFQFRFGGRSRAPICVMGECVADQWVDGKWFNRLSDHFSMAEPAQTLVVANHFEWGWHLPRHHERIIFHAPQQASNAIVGKLMARESHRRRARDLITIVRDRAKRHLGWTLGPQREHSLVAMLSRKSASLPFQYRAYQSLLDRIQPQLLMVTAGCYGPAASLIAAAKNAGIVTAEHQHGAVSSGHDAYNFAPTIRDSASYRKTLPDHFLAYGTWWNDQINAPLIKTVIGNPHRSARLAHTEGLPVSKEDVLILSDGIEFGLYLELARQIEPGATKRGLRVVLRPHPLEKTLVAASYGGAVGKILIDQNTDLYTSMHSAYAVVSEVSTGLFEAVGLAEKIFIWDTPKSRFGYPSHPFQMFSSAATLMEQFDQTDFGRVAPSISEAIWAPAWSDRYAAFLRAQGIACAP